MAQLVDMNFSHFKQKARISCLCKNKYERKEKEKNNVCNCRPTELSKLSYLSYELNYETRKTHIIRMYVYEPAGEERNVPTF